MPKKIPTGQAQFLRGVDTSGLAALVLIFIRPGLWELIDFLEQLGIEHRRADAIPATGPLTQVNQPATLTAEGEMLIGAQNDALASRTAKTKSFLASHTYSMRATIS